MNTRYIIEAVPRANDHLRFLETWLPLAEEASRLYGWDLDPLGLEALILKAARSLIQSRTVLEARLSL